MPPQPKLARGPNAATYPAEHLNGIGSPASLPLWVASEPGGPGPPMMAVHEWGWRAPATVAGLRACWQMVTLLVDRAQRLWCGGFPIGDGVVRRRLPGPVSGS